LQLIFSGQQTSISIEIGEVNIKLKSILIYSDNKSNGAFILIDAAKTQRSRVYKLIPIPAFS
jgi:sulfate adenylyltransferase subunit 1 (EFTu-like GTPase family)